MTTPSDSILAQTENTVNRNVRTMRTILDNMLDMFALCNYTAVCRLRYANLGGDQVLWNLEAEQKRRGLSNEQMAKLLSVSRATYEVKKKNSELRLVVNNGVALCTACHNARHPEKKEVKGDPPLMA